MMAVGNVGESLAPYTESDTFLSRDAGFTWEEVHKDAHLWEFGDSGSILVIANDEEPTDHVLFSTDEGLTWREYKFSTQDKIRVKSIVTVPTDTSRRFILFGYYPRSVASAVAVHLDFTSLTRKQCELMSWLSHSLLIVLQAYLIMIILITMTSNSGVLRKKGRSAVSLDARLVCYFACVCV